MTYKIQINTIESLEEIPNYWSVDDYKKLLELFNFPDSQSIKTENLWGMLQMAIADFEPADAAKIVLEYKLSEQLNAGQIDQLSHEMLLDKISEEYPDISLHYTLFNINQMLYKAFNGTFPNAKATLLKFSISTTENRTEFTKGQILKILYKGLSPRNIIIRLFEEQLTTTIDFPDAESIIWELKNEDNTNFQLITSEYWLSREDVAYDEFESSLIEELK
ncbi:hypothetical protein [Flavobacterium sp.]|uniref:hypothetical protein n=1 Tax=Flavobacterium sp. TaxID=239 RepID=UPI00248A7AE9|nr:hypothetical protein [Flavobacterium sp.]MDI1317149.1 hypothetical protein [Flavobacterium sp.]